MVSFMRLCCVIIKNKMITFVTQATLILILWPVLMLFFWMKDVGFFFFLSQATGLQCVWMNAVFTRQLNWTSLTHTES